ncbi:mechanosensitive ion channel family protein [Myroides pelagicus]|uniref:Mechanosensitive ion channel n=1 Tax=Myroides pelagicus TaxID=270914 RepID=A0A7K1GJF4_9FLAO|nr:mechanosensitive ion channel [Myroides pelagicus]MEC4112982.1 mechanosensitive ion channel [Myroides pelagicus]MTH29015.1 mechanosensitive ion channel [Myroides pelagicus]
MNKLTDFEYPTDMLNTVVDSFVKGALGFVLILGYILLCWVLVKFFAYLLKKIFHFFRLQSIQKLIDENEFLARTNVNIKIDAVIVFFMKVFLIFLMVVIGAEMFGLTIVSKEIGNLMLYIPQVFIALLIFVGGLYLATWLKKAVVGVLKAVDFSGARMIGNIVFYFLLVFVVITTLNQIGINTSIITNNISIIVGAVLLTVALSIGLGAKDVVTRLLFSFYTRKNLELGQLVKINGLEGYVISIDNIYLCLLVDGKKHYLPIKTVSESHIEIVK